MTQRLDKAAREQRRRREGRIGKLKAFLEYLGEGDNESEIIQLRAEVEEWVGTFSLPWESST